ncbi:MAG: DUF2569 domain-containing protein [Terracidiphilus sp.]
MTIACSNCAAAVADHFDLCPACGMALAAASPGTSEAAAVAAKAEENGVFSGWLVLVGAGLLIAPLMVVATMGMENFPYLFDQTRLEYFAAQPAALALGRFELAANVVYLALLSGLNYLYFEKKKAFQVSMIVYLVVQLALASFDYVQLRALHAATVVSLIEGAGRAAMLAALGIPYLLVSRRVKATFTR